MAPANSRTPVFHFLIKMRVLGRKLGLGDQGCLFVRQLTGLQHASVSTTQPLVCAGRQDSQAASTVPGDRHRLQQRSIRAGCAIQ
jgi:hypothetical protein